MKKRILSCLLCICVLPFVFSSGNSKVLNLMKTVNLTEVKGYQLETSSPELIKNNSSDLTVKFNYPDVWTVEDLPTELKDVLEWEKTESIHIIAQLPEQDIYLYGLFKGYNGGHGGVLLRKGRQITEFSWDYLTPRNILPEISYKDYDNDGKCELAVILYVGSGTGIAIEQLHIIEFDGSEMTDKILSEELYSVDLSGKMNLKMENEKAELSIGDQKVIINEFLPFEDAGNVFGVFPIQFIVEFSFSGNKITANFGVGIKYELIATPFFVADLKADVSYKNGEYNFSDFILTKINC